MDKIMKHKIFILIFTSLVILVLLAFFFWFNKLRQENRQLIDFVPQNSWQYFEINFDNKYLQQILSQKKVIKNELDNFLIKQGLPNNLWKSDCKILKLGLAQIKLIEDNKSKNEKVWFIYSSSDDIKLLETLNLKNYYLIYLTKNIVALTNSETLAIKIKNNKSGRLMSLWNNDSDKLIDGYINLENYLDEKKLIKQKKIIENYIDIKNKLKWKINISEDNEVVINFDLAIKNNLLKDKLLKGDSNNFVIPSNTIVIKNFNGDLVFNVLENKLMEQFEGNEDLFKQLLKNKYQINIEELYTLFEQPLSVVVQPKNNNLVWQNFLNDKEKFDYFYGLIWQTDSKFIQNNNIVNLEKLIQNYLAFKFPVSRKKILPDGTSGFELVADPDQVVWQNKILQNGEELHLLKFKNYEYAYIQYEDKFIFANSEKMINNILQAPKKVEDNNFYNIFVSPKIIKVLKKIKLSEMYLGATIKGKFLKIKTKLLWNDLDLGI